MNSRDITLVEQYCKEDVVDEMSAVSLPSLD